MRKHNHYFKDVSNLKEIDVYRVLQLFQVDDQALGHAIKKLLCAGQRGAGKDHRQDIQEAIDTLQRRLEMQDEDEAPLRNLVESGLTGRVSMVKAEPGSVYADGWLPWNGQGRPVDLKAIVDVKLRSGKVLMGHLAEFVQWSHDHGDENVMFYRQVGKAG